MLTLQGKPKKYLYRFWHLIFQVAPEKTAPILFGIAKNL